MLIRIVDYDRAWPGRFDEEAARIRAALGCRALAIEHVGSTSVPGLAAKPVIDIVLAVADSANEEDYAAALIDGGYRFHLREPEWFEHRLFQAPANDVNLHVFTHGCPEIARMLAFRQWLRQHADDRELYARSKLALAAREWKTTQDYADAKTQVVRQILSRACPE